MRILRYIIFLAAAMTAALFFVRCGETPEEEVPWQPVENLDDASLYNAFRQQFDEGRKLVKFYDQGAGSYRVLFDDGKTRGFDTGDVPVFVCTNNTWPSLVPGQNGKWLINGEDTGVPVTDLSGNESIVAVVYDTEALYVRLSSGRIMFFHYGKVLDIGCFRFEAALNPSLSSDVICTVSTGVITGSVGKNTGSYDFVATVAYRANSLVYDSKPVQSSVTSINYSDGKSFSLHKSSVTLLYSVNISGLTRRIPVLSISTSGKTIDRNNYISATLRVEDPDLMYATAQDETLTMEIKGRGNSTWDKPKKPYKIKLSSKKRLLGMSNNKHWVLLANYSDKSLLRNIAAFEISRQLGMAWVPRSRPVEVYLNGSYRGQYMLTEHVRVDSERVNIDIVGSSDNSGTAVTGGYFLSIDERYGEPSHFTTATTGLPVCFVEPEAPTTEQFNYLKNYYRDAENVLYGSNFKDPNNGYRAWIDVRSFIQNFLVQEITRNVDGNMRLSTYMWKPYQGKLGFPCVWDFDIALGNCDYQNTSPEGWDIRYCRWYGRLFEDDAFKSDLREVWRELYPKLPQVEATIREWAALIDDAQKRNFNTWQILGIYVWPNVNPGSRTTYSAELEYMLDYFNKRTVWMNSRIEGWVLP